MGYNFSSSRLLPVPVFLHSIFTMVTASCLHSVAVFNLCLYFPLLRAGYGT